VFIAVFILSLPRPVCSHTSHHYRTLPRLTLVNLINLLTTNDSMNDSVTVIIISRSVYSFIETLLSHRDSIILLLSLLLMLAPGECFHIHFVQFLPHAAVYNAQLSLVRMCGYCLCFRPSVRMLLVTMCTSCVRHGDNIFSFVLSSTSFRS